MFNMESIADDFLETLAIAATITCGFRYTFAQGVRNVRSRHDWVSTSCDQTPHTHAP